MDRVLTGFTLVDGTGREPVERAALAVRGARIEWVGRQADLPPACGHWPTEDLHGCAVIPGLIDAHVHVCWNGRESVPDLVREPRDHVLLDATSTLRKILASGTTTVRDLGGQDFVEMSLRWGIEQGHLHGPRLKTSGQFITMTGGHCHFIGREVDGPEEVRKAAREQIKAGADNVKLMATGGVATAGQDIETSQLTTEEMAAAVDVARTMRRTTAAHAHGARGIRNAVLAGVDSVEHGSYLDEESADLMRQHGTALVLTLSLANSQVTEVSATARAEADRIRPYLADVRRRLQDTIDIARKTSVFIASGTDAGGNPLVPHDFSMVREVEELVRYGIPALEALHIATANNARVLRAEKDLGTLETGKLADLVVLDGNPLADLGALRRVRTVYQGGRAVFARGQFAEGAPAR